jgi:tetratricopeptide (TPR) repeat protein
MILVTHYEKLGDVQKAMSFREKVIECGGSYGDYAAASCMWFADHYVKHGDKVKAFEYLNKILEKYNGSYGKAKKAAEAKIKSLDK